MGRGVIASALLEDSTRRERPEVVVLPGELLTGKAARLALTIVDVEPAETVGVLTSLRPLLENSATVVVVTTELSLARLREALGAGPTLVLAVPGPGIETGSGMIVLSAEEGAAPEPVAEAARLLGTVGAAQVVPENLLTAAAAVMESSAASLTLAMEGIEQGAVEAGLSRETARAFVRQTALTTALLLRDHAGSPADLKDQVASPGGTTIAGLAALEDQAVRGAFLRMVETAGRWKTATG